MMPFASKLMSSDHYSEKYLKRQFFKAGRTGSIEVFDQAYQKTLESEQDPTDCK